MTDIKQIETTTAIISLRSDGIIETRPLQVNPEITGKHIAHELVTAAITFCEGGKKRQVISFLSNRRLCKEERQYYSKNPNHWFTDIALIVDNPYKKMIGNFFMGLNKLPIPTRLFTTEESALLWLEKQNKK